MINYLLGMVKKSHIINSVDDKSNYKKSLNSDLAQRDSSKGGFSPPPGVTSAYSEDEPSKQLLNSPIPREDKSS